MGGQAYLLFINADVISTGILGNDVKTVIGAVCLDV